MAKAKGKKRAVVKTVKKGGKNTKIKKPAASKSKVAAKKKSATKAINNRKPIKKTKSKMTTSARKAKKPLQKSKKPQLKKPSVKKTAKTNKKVSNMKKKSATQTNNKGKITTRSNINQSSKPVLVSKKTVILKSAKGIETNVNKLSTKKSTINRTANLGTMGIPPYQERKGEGYMSEKQRTHFREILVRWKQELMQGVDSTIHHMQDDAANFPDPNDRATQEEEFSLELRARDRDRKLIKKIEEALQKIDNDEYGYCDECGIEIGIRRLEARPTATLCIDCKTLDEIKEKQLSGS